MQRGLFAIVLALVLGAASMAQAHTFGAHGAGFVAGIVHPFGGWDHLLAMLAVGVWAAQLGGKAQGIVPLAFVTCMIVGGLAAFAGLRSEIAELGILGSVLVFGLLIAAAPRLPLWLPALAVGGFALFHGHAHGLEMPEAASPIAYAAGFVFATVTLHLLGIGLAFGSRRILGPLAVRALGAAATVGGLVLAAV